MGSFTEVVLAFDFRRDTPDEVLAGFAALHVVPPDPMWSKDTTGLAEPFRSHFQPPPSLPEPFDGADEDWEPTDEMADPAEDPTPWAHDWASWLSGSMSVSITPSAQLMWSQVNRWHLSSRWGIKSWPEAIIPALTWLAPHIEPHGDPTLLGYMRYDGSTRPTLLWSNGTSIIGEDLDDVR